MKEKFVVCLAEHRSFGRVKLTDTLAGKDHIQRVFSSFCQDFAKITVLVDGEVLHLIYVDVAWRDRKSTRLNSSHMPKSRMPSSA